MKAIDELAKHKELGRRASFSKVQLQKVRDAIANEEALSEPDIVLFCAGSLARHEAGEQSDLDVFVVSKGQCTSKLKEVRLLSRLADLNDKLEFPPFSDEMRYLKVYDSSKLIGNTGKPLDDTENSFTTRMLLLLESKALGNDSGFSSLQSDVCENYFRDNKGKESFRPLFLINDLLRYWRTLCLNYEGTRDDPMKPWRKKNVNLRFSRLTTVFSSIAVLMLEKTSSSESLLPHLKLTPLQRLATAVDALSDDSLRTEFSAFLDHYSTFLRVKDSRDPERLLEMRDTKQKMRQSSEYVAEYFHRIFMAGQLKDNYRYLLM